MRSILFVLIFLGCKENKHPRDNAQINSIANKVSIHDISLSKDTASLLMDTITINRYMDTIFSLPEVKRIDKILRARTKNKHGVSIIVEDGFNDDSSYYCYKVGDNTSWRFETIYNFVVDKKTRIIKIYEGAGDTLLFVEAWRKPNLK